MNKPDFLDYIFILSTYTFFFSFVYTKKQLYYTNT